MGNGKEGDRQMKTKEVTIVSGKGGTGKTSITAALAALSPLGIVLCDADVDAPDLEILLHPEPEGDFPFMGMQTAGVDTDRCTGCGKCEDVCRFGAIKVTGGKARVDKTFCEGCSACALVCPVKCIAMEDTRQGTWFRGMTEHGPMVHARLNPGGENSGMLVQLVRKVAKEVAEKSGAGMILTDGPPGIACPAISAITGADAALIVTEPTMSGRHDMLRIADLCRRFGTSAAVVLNKADLSSEGSREIEEACRENGLPLLASIPFILDVVHAVSQARIPSKELATHLEPIWRYLQGM